MELNLFWLESLIHVPRLPILNPRKEVNGTNGKDEMVTCEIEIHM